MPDKFNLKGSFEGGRTSSNRLPSPNQSQRRLFSSKKEQSKSHIGLQGLSSKAHGSNQYEMPNGGFSNRVMFIEKKRSRVQPFIQKVQTSSTVLKDHVNELAKKK